MTATTALQVHRNAPKRTTLAHRLEVLCRLVAERDRDLEGHLAARVERAFDDLVHAFDARVRTLSPAEAARLGAVVQKVLTRIQYEERGINLFDQRRPL